MSPIDIIIDFRFMTRARAERLLELVLAADEGADCTYHLYLGKEQLNDCLRSLILDLVTSKCTVVNKVGIDTESYETTDFVKHPLESNRRFLARQSWYRESIAFLQLLDRFERFIFLGADAVPTKHGWLSSILESANARSFPVLSAFRRVKIDGLDTPCGWGKTGWYNASVLRALPWDKLKNQVTLNPWWGKIDFPNEQHGSPFCLQTEHLSMNHAPIEFITFYLYFREKEKDHDLLVWLRENLKFDSPGVIAEENPADNRAMNTEALLLTHSERTWRNALRRLNVEKGQRLNSPSKSPYRVSDKIPLGRPCWNYLGDNLLKFSITDMRDRFKGERCFILGNGPSLNKTDLSVLANEYTFGLNRIYLNSAVMGFHTTFLCVTNINVITQFHGDIDNVPSIKFLNNSGRDLIANRWNTFFMEHKGIHEFNTDLSNGFWCEGSTVTYCAMQVAYYLGFSRVILVGVDHGFVNSGTPHKLVTAEGPDENHFHPDYFGKGTKWQYPDLAGSEVSYRVAKSAYESDGRKIFDATVGGKLQIFEKVDLDHALTL